MTRNPAQELLGYTVSVDDDRTRILFAVEDCHVNRRGDLHGGITAALLDAACGQQGRRDLGPDHPDGLITVSLTISYMARATLGDRLIGTAQFTGGGKRTRHMAAELRRDDGTLIASAVGVFRVVFGSPN